MSLAIRSLVFGVLPFYVAMAYLFWDLNWFWESGQWNTLDRSKCLVMFICWQVGVTWFWALRLAEIRRRDGQWG